MIRKRIPARIVSLILMVAVAGGVGADEESDDTSAAQAGTPDLFGVYTATLSGQNVKRIFSDSRRQINHARVSPDGQWITFTRFNGDSDGNGLCEEGKDTYELTEVLVCRIDGSDMETILPPQEGHINANSYWLPDGKSIIAISAPIGTVAAGIVVVDLETKEKRAVPTPGVIAGDPHLVGDRIVFAGLKAGEKKMSLWIIKGDGSELRRLTDPAVDGTFTRPQPLPGDFDPKFSPDGTEVAFMRHLSDTMFHLLVVDVESGEERDLSPADVQEPYADAVPEWSPDGERIAFFQICFPLSEMGLYTMKRDGTDRRRIPLPDGYFYTFPVLFPGDRFGDEARIIFSARKGMPEG